mmetsp:Transcript_46287/g.143383  ORF Transcript_46287/g.143383 Transcript_46287/m.143383 type:complete len:214 (+) Transcript_46287:88-729(+)
MQRSAEPELLERAVHVGARLHDRLHEADDVVLDGKSQGVLAALVGVAAQPLHDDPRVGHPRHHSKTQGTRGTPGPVHWPTESQAERLQQLVLVKSTPPSTTVRLQEQQVGDDVCVDTCSEDAGLEKASADLAGKVPNLHLVTLRLRAPSCAEAARDLLCLWQPAQALHHCVQEPEPCDGPGEHAGDKEAGGYLGGTLICAAKHLRLPALANNP